MGVVPPFEDVPGLLAWLAEMSPRDRHRTSVLLANHQTSVILAGELDREVCGMLRSGGGTMRRAEVAGLLGTTVDMVRLRVTRFRKRQAALPYGHEHGTVDG